MRRLLLAICSLLLLVGVTHAKDSDVYEVVIVWQPERPINTGSTTIGGVVMTVNRSGDEVNVKAGLVDSKLSDEDRAKLNECKDLIERMARGLALQRISVDNATLQRRHNRVKDLQKQFEEAGCGEFFADSFGQSIVDEIAAKLPG